MKQISLELLNKVANYLAGRPYIEVFQLIQEISNLQDVVKDVVEKGGENARKI